MTQQRLVSYFIVRSSEDGLEVWGPLSEAIAKQYIEEQDTALTFLHEFPVRSYGSSLNYAPEGTTVLIKGEIVVPKAVKVGEKYEL